MIKWEKVELNHTQQPHHRPAKLLQTAHKNPLHFILPLLPEVHTHTELLIQEMETRETAATQLVTEPYSLDNLILQQGHTMSLKHLLHTVRASIPDSHLIIWLWSCIPAQRALTKPCFNQTG